MGIFDALKYQHKMNHISSHLLLSVCNKKCRDLSRKDRTNLALEIFLASSDGRSIHMYNMLLKCHSENKYNYSPSNVLKRMAKDNIEPNKDTLEKIVGHYLKMGNQDEANRVKAYMEAKNWFMSDYYFARDIFTLYCW